MAPYIEKQGMNHKAGLLTLFHPQAPSRHQFLTVVVLLVGIIELTAAGQSGIFTPFPY